MEIANISTTLLKPEATKEQVEKLCNEAKQAITCFCLCQSTWVKLASDILKVQMLKFVRLLVSARCKYARN